MPTRPQGAGQLSVAREPTFRQVIHMSTTEQRGIWSEALSKAQAVKVRNVMNPLLWQNAVAMPLLLVSAYVFREQPILSVPLGLGAMCLPIWTMWEFRYFARTDPRRLQSEEYLIEQQRLMIQSKSSSVALDAASLPMSGNPELAPPAPIVGLPSVLDDMDRSPSSEAGNV